MQKLVLIFPKQTLIFQPSYKEKLSIFKVVAPFGNQFAASCILSILIRLTWVPVCGVKLGIGIGVGYI